VLGRINDRAVVFVALWAPIWRIVFLIMSADVNARPVN
jgi:hypothetical protein